MLLAVLFWLVADLWFGKAVTVRGLSLQNCTVSFAKQLHLSGTWRAQPASWSLSAALKAVKSPVSEGKIEEPHKCSDFCFDCHDFTLQGLKVNSSCASSNSWYLHVSLTYLGRKLAQSLAQLCRNYSGLLCGRFLAGMRLHAVTLLERQYTESQPQPLCFSLKAAGEGTTALCGKEETTSSLFRCLQLWQKQSVPRWLMSRQAGCEEQSSGCLAELAVGIPQGEVGCSTMAERALGLAHRADCTEGSCSSWCWCFNHWWLQQGLISRPHTV